MLVAIVFLVALLEHGRALHPKLKGWRVTLLDPVFCGLADSFESGGRYQPFNPFSSRNRNDHVHWIEPDLHAFYDFVERKERLNAAEELQCGRALSAWREVEEVFRTIYAQNDTYENVLHAVAAQVGQNVTQLEDLSREADSAMKRLVNCNLKLVLGIVSRYRCNDIPNSELIAEGSRGLARAAERYDYSKGFRFATYATWYVHQAVASYIKSRQHLAKMPTVYAQIRRRIKNITEEYHNRTGTTPSIMYLAHALMRSPFDVVKVLSMNKYPTLLSSAVPARKASHRGKLDARERTREDLLHSDLSDPAALAEERDAAISLQALLHVNLSPQERGVLLSRLGISDGRCKPFKDVGTEFDITWRQVRSVEKQAISKLKELRAAPQVRISSDTASVDNM